MASNLPPGVTEGMIPGNRPEDVAWEAAYEWALDQFTDSDLTLDEFKRAVFIGIAAVKAEREIVSALLEEARAEERIIARMAGKEGDDGT